VARLDDSDHDPVLRVCESAGESLLRFAFSSKGMVSGDNSLTGNGRDIKSDISGAFARSARLDADGLSISTSPGSVTLSGVVRSWAEHDEAIAAAWAAPGVTEVYDRIKVEY
jgi:osmotically-inducible protein OsmY